MSSNNESKVERRLDQLVRAIGGITRKWCSPSHVGVPDRIVILKGRVIFVEVKTYTGKLSSAQIREHQRLRDNGAEVRVVYGDSGVDELIMELMGSRDCDTL